MYTTRGSPSPDWRFSQWLMVAVPHKSCAPPLFEVEALLKLTSLDSLWNKKNNGQKSLDPCSELWSVHTGFVTDYSVINQLISTQLIYYYFLNNWLKYFSHIWCPCCLSVHLFYAPIFDNGAFRAMVTIEHWYKKPRAGCEIRWSVLWRNCIVTSYKISIILLFQSVIDWLRARCTIHT